MSVIMLELIQALATIKDSRITTAKNNRYVAFFADSTESLAKNL